MKGSLLQHETAGAAQLKSFQRVDKWTSNWLGVRSSDVAAVARWHHNPPCRNLPSNGVNITIRTSTRFLLPQRRPRPFTTAIDGINREDETDEGRRSAVINRRRCRSFKFWASELHTNRQG